MAIQNNFLSPLGYQLTIKKMPNAVFNVTSVILPGITVEDSELQTPFKIIRYPDKVVYNDFIVRFKVDENMENYLEIFNWMVEIGRPEFFATGQPSPLIANDIYSNFVCDGTLLILNSANKPNIEVRFKDLFPVVIGDIEFTSSETDVSYVDVSVNFRCLSFTLHTS